MHHHVERLIHTDCLIIRIFSNKSKEKFNEPANKLGAFTEYKLKENLVHPIIEKDTGLSVAWRWKVAEQGYPEAKLKQAM